MKNTESLRGHEAFRRVFRTGRRLHGKMIQCFYVFDPSPSTFLYVGYAVPSRVYHAVRRNRIRRLMREAVRMRRDVVREALQKSGLAASVVFYFGEQDDESVERLKLHHVAEEIGDICDRLVAKLRQRESSEDT